jgi:predicted XRE-type DNA-binding protein
MNSDRDKASPQITIGSDNIFADLGLENAEEMLVKAKLARQIYVCITERQLSQIEAANILGIDQPKVSNLINGKLAAFSLAKPLGTRLERLFRFLNTLDRDVEITIKAKSCKHNSAKVIILN